MVLVFNVFRACKVGQAYKASQNFV